MIDLNKATQELDRATVPAGVYRVRCKLIPGDGGEDGDLTLSASGFLYFLKVHFIIKEGKHKGAVVHDQINVELSDAKLPSNKADNFRMAVEIGRACVRALIEAARGVAPDDDGPKARRKRQIEEWGEIDGITCSIRVGIKPASGAYSERNVVLGVLPQSHTSGDGDEMDEETP